MQIGTATVDRRDFLRAVNLAKRAARRDSKIPILSQLRIHSENGSGLRVAANNLDQLISIAVPATNEGEIDTTVPADALHKVLTGATDDLAVLSHDGNGGKLNIEFRQRPFRSSGAALATLPAVDFPQPDFRAPVAFTISAGQLLNTLTRTVFAASQEETRYYLNGVYLSGWISSEDTKSLRFAATNGHMLADIWLHKFQLADPFPPTIIPSPAVADIMAMCKGLASSDLVTVSVGRRVIVVTSGNDGVYSKTVDGAYPDIDKVVRKTNQITARAYLSDARAALSVLGKAATKSNAGAKFEFAADHCSVTHKNHESGDATGAFPCTLTGGPLTIGFNVKYIAALLDSLQGREVVFGLEDAGAPVNITDPLDDGARLVLMPMRV